MTNETEYGPDYWGGPIDGETIMTLGVSDETPTRYTNDGCDHSRTYADFYYPDPEGLFYLPATHPFYAVQSHNAKHGTQFKYWPGGDDAPGDYAGGPVLFREGVASAPESRAWRWTHHTAHDGVDIIGYTPKPCAAQRHVDEPEPMSEKAREMLGLDAGGANCGNCKLPAATITENGTVADFVPCERTLLLLQSKMPVMMPEDYVPWKDKAGCFVDALTICHDTLEDMLPQKDRAEELLQRWYNDDTAEQASFTGMLRWLIAQGEIRG